MKLMLASALLVASMAAHAETVSMLDPGDGRQYLATWCGGQTINEVAEGFDAANNPTTIVSVTTRCSTGGKGAKTRTSLGCARVTFQNGVRIAIEHLPGGSWLQGQPALTCPVTPDPTLTYRLEDVDGNLLASLSTALVSGVYRAFLTQ